MQGCIEDIEVHAWITFLDEKSHEITMTFGYGWRFKTKPSIAEDGFCEEWCNCKLQILDTLQNKTKTLLYPYPYSHPQIDGKVNPYQFIGDLLFHLFGDDYTYLYKFIYIYLYL